MKKPLRKNCLMHNNVEKVLTQLLKNLLQVFSCGLL